MNTDTPSTDPTPAPFTMEPWDGPCTPMAVLENLLKHPGRIIAALHSNRAGNVAGALALILLFCLGVYGWIAGSLTGGAQTWIAPVKMGMGSVAAAVICLPSLYIFLCLGGVDVHLRGLSATVLGAIALTWLLLIGFAPMVWVFSQSTDSVALMTILHLVFWSVALRFGLRFLHRGTCGVVPRGDRHLVTWNILYVVVCLQMMTSLRPIIGRSDSFIPGEKRFFVVHFLDVLQGR